jgi:CBS domain-containing protein
MTVFAICNPNVATIRGDAGVVEAAREMRETHVGDLVVVERRESRTVPVGILTDRDIVVGVVAQEAAPDDLTVADVMSANLLKLDEHAGVEFALKTMHEAGIRRAPVVGARGELVGILSIDDVIGHLAAQLGHIAGLLRVEQQRETKARP